MIQAISGSVVLDQEQSAGVKTDEYLGGPVIQAVRGEFYAYSHRFTEERPLYVLMKCKANKSRPIRAAAALGREVNIVFVFDGDGVVRAYPADVAHEKKLIDGLSENNPFGRTWIGVTGISRGDFYMVRSSMDAGRLVAVCRDAELLGDESVTLASGQVVVMMTDADKYGLFLVREIAGRSVLIDACHVLL